MIIAVAIHFYRIAQEAISNAIKHGKAKKILLQVTERDGVFHLNIRDDGIGLTTRIPHIMAWECTS